MGEAGGEKGRRVTKAFRRPSGAGMAEIRGLKQRREI
jgi:hypothetical protein